MYRFVLTFIVGASIVATLVGREQIANTLTSEHSITDKINALLFLKKKEQEELEARRKAEAEDSDPLAGNPEVRSDIQTDIDIDIDTKAQP
ncbi:hypothetical protein N8T08_006679 [Aspergillus melleus]|uniref:Uncharacterized protein n=1 Tax=Aspergillus melleus TaxID=138277 RepID=A0ACC3BGC1_9EURO|nr:hypothetical protein N8T08_006679 [Aspergillus melleus]